MDPNPGPVNPDPPKPRPHDIAEPGPIDPVTGQPDHQAEVFALKSWLRQNAVSLIITAAVVVLVCIYLDPIDTIKVVLGLGLVIFIHELGHFLAAKWCDVHVKTFSIGFGPAVPFCSHKWGETTYMVGIIPLGGYVSMVGEGTGETGGEVDPEEEENDPRSFKQKSVRQRMLIISAGVIMNVILGMGCFMAAYLHGVQEKPASVGWVESGTAAWRAGIRTDADIKKIGSRENPFFNDIRPVVMSSLKGEQVPITVEYRGQRTEMMVEPLRDEGVPFPQLGVAPPYSLKLMLGGKKKVRPVIPGSPAADVQPIVPKFEPGDEIVAMTDPKKVDNENPFLFPNREPPPLAITPVTDYNEFYRRMVLLADKPVTIVVTRAGASEQIRITVQPEKRADLGVRMQMGKVAAIRTGGPADGKVQAIPAGTVGDGTGDRIKAVKLPGERQTWYVDGPVDWNAPEFKTDDPKKVDVQPLDPLLLPLQLNRWADANPKDRTVRLVVLRQQGHREDDPVELTMEFDPSYRFDREVVMLPNTPLPISGLGLAYRVNAVASDVAPGSPAADPDPIDPNAARPGALKPGDQIVAVRFKSVDEAGTVKTGGDWNDIKGYQWASVDAILQRTPPHQIDLRVKRGDETFEVSLKARPDPEWPNLNWSAVNRGLVFQDEIRLQTASGIGDALNLGARRTVRFIKDVYMNLYAIVFGRVSAKTMSGPLTIANVSYRLAGEDFWQFLLFLGMISVNLAVVNFLPIPVLDGGHMVFLLYESITGRPMPERLFAIAMYIGLFLILALMVYVLSLDVRRLFFGLF